MVKRIILWKIKDDQNKQANLNLLREELLGLANKIGDIVSVEVGLNYSSADFDIIFIVAFEDPFQLKQFQSHPEFLKIHQQAQSISVNMIYCDYMAEGTGISQSTPTPQTPSRPAGLIGSSGNTGRMPNINNLNNPNNMQSNNMQSIGSNGMFGSMPKSEPNLDGTKPFVPINNKNTPPFAGNNFSSPTPYSNGMNNMSQSKNGVNFTTSENVNQIRFAGAKSNSNNNSNGNGGDTWKCSKCGKTNSSFINMCSCGRKKPVDNPNSMLLNSSLLPKVPSMPKPNVPSSNGAWMCPSCGKSNNEFMKVCVCGHRKDERHMQANSPNGMGGFNNQPNNIGFNGPNMNMPKNPAMGMNNIKSPNNNEFFNSFGGNRMNQPMNNKPNNMNSNPGGMGNTPNNMGGGPGGMNNNRNMQGGPGGPGGMNNNRNMPGGPSGMTGMNNNRNMQGTMNPNMSRMQFNAGPGGPNNMMPPNKVGGPNNLPPDSWKCPRCGKVLGNFVGQCICGQRKPTRPGGAGTNNTHMRFN